MKNYILAVVLLFAAISLLKAQQEDKIFVEQPELLFSGGQGLLLEGPTFSPKGFLYFTDLIGFSMNPGDKTSLIWKYDVENKKASVYRSPSGQANGMMVDKQGRLVVCEGSLFGGRRITRTDLKTGISELIVGLYNDKPFNGPNDIAIDEQGRMYFTDPKFMGHEIMEQPVHGIYRVDTNLTTQLIIEDIKQPNGIIISPDQTTLYISTSNKSSALLAYDITSEEQVKFKGKIADFGPSIGDGMAVDTDGNIYVAHPMQNRLAVYTTKGGKIDEIRLPNEPITNMVFGRGENSNTLFITTGKNLYSIKTSKKGYNLPFEK